VELVRASTLLSGDIKKTGKRWQLIAYDAASSYAMARGILAINACKALPSSSTWLQRSCEGLERGCNECSPAVKAIPGWSSQSMRQPPCATCGGEGTLCKDRWLR